MGSTRSKPSELTKESAFKCGKNLNDSNKFTEAKEYLVRALGASSKLDAEIYQVFATNASNYGIMDEMDVLFCYYMWCLSICKIPGAATNISYIYNGKTSTFVNSRVEEARPFLQLEKYFLDNISKFKSMMTKSPDIKDFKIHEHDLKKFDNKHGVSCSKCKYYDSAHACDICHYFLCSDCFESMQCGGKSAVVLERLKYFITSDSNYIRINSILNPKNSYELPGSYRYTNTICCLLRIEFFSDENCEKYQKKIFNNNF